jgi:acid stress-induced BolA-like protein IbaG/YrbA
MLTPEQLKQYIASGLQCDVLDVNGDGHHFEAVIVARAFDGLPRVRQHQLVYQVLGDRMRQEIHALSMKTYTPHEWKNLA